VESVSHFLDDPPIDVEPLVEIEFHGLEQGGGLESLTGGDDLF